MLSYKKYLILVVSVLAITSLFFVLANTADAAGLVPCDTSENPRPCTKCDIFVLIQRIVNYFAGILVPVIATLLIVIGGFMMLLGGAKPSMFASGKTLFWNVMIGLLIFYGAWMITNTILRSLAGESNPFAAWNEIVCEEGAPIAPPPAPTPTPDPEASVCSRCGEGFLNICDETECSELGGVFEACKFESGPLGGSCVPDEDKSGGGGAGGCFGPPGEVSSCGVGERACRGTRICQESGQFTQCDFSSANGDACQSAGGTMGTCSEGTCVSGPTPTPTSTPTPPGGGGLSEEDARQQLAAANITVNADPPQTTLVGMKQTTIDEIIRFKNSCGCTVIVSGGTEEGHTEAHTQGYKLDLGLNPTLNRFIIQNYQYIGVRSDGARMFRAPNGVVYALESDHWDVDVR